MIKSCLAIIVGIAVTIVAEVPANAAGMTYLPGGDAATILLTGEIVEGDAEALRVALRRAAERGHSIQGLNLNSVGGSVFEGINIVRIVHAANLNTAVLSGATCASICFLAFAAGHMKFADLKSRVGVHAASGEFGQDNSASRAGTAAMSRIAQRLRVPARIVGWMMATPPEKMSWLAKSDLESMGVKIIADARASGD